MAREQTFEVGQRVAYNHRFLKQIAAGYDIASLRGTVEDTFSFSGRPAAKVRWQDEEDTHSVLFSNLCRAPSSGPILDPTE